ncbi:hypothetical protein GLOIN_2v1560160 [Rhizophagus irregularis DAOM 181602=DAOM 197198]|nr:hypothetical protein GLOIN_2v1560160 [Rhizophagus irregularis DAOM 181602=DAOM 197198]POG75929.1 hypothetical protein GLOIN_2v1560160 [Rhizophagus irregularis DAOM 181602=DAOM 197198]|eukprot:XP_025182795.1 hypothetical protein GLOIN_2v1560160 [Rhizophagus irregularis DAOM 181602=DAOM 197198]
MRKHKPLVEFIETHCQERAYSFQIKKCNQATYKIRYPIRMPIDIFLIQYHHEKNSVLPQSIWSLKLVIHD